MDSKEFIKREINRRQFLGSSAKNAAGMAAGMVGLAGAAIVAKAAANERARLAVIGVRNQGKSLAKSFAGLPDADIVTICDIDERMLASATSVIEKIQGYPPRHERDFRRVLDDDTIDGVIIATPDHWHAYMTIAACQAVKDVYVEKPVSHNIVEGDQMVAAARRHNRVVQSGIQQRSGAHFQSAVEYVQSGNLGTVRLAKAWTIHRRKAIGYGKEAPTPSGIDYDMWLGPAPERTFQPNRFHYNWRWFWDYGTGEMGNWGVHMLDIARWGMDVALPNRISATGGKFYFEDDQETPDTQVVNYTYDDVTITWEHRLWTGHGIEGRSAAAAFYGDKGTLVVDRGGWKVYDQESAPTSDTSDQSLTHHKNFVACIKSRETPTADIEIGHVSSTLCHLGNIAYRLGRDIHLDRKSLTFTGDDEANAMRGRAYENGWELPTI